nr:MAG TPA: hypothetical protein [Caudoviricetes sp.]
MTLGRHFRSVCRQPKGLFFLSCDGGFLTVLCSSIRHAGPFTDGPERRAAWPEISTGTP